MDKFKKDLMWGFSFNTNENLQTSLKNWKKNENKLKKTVLDGNLARFWT